MGIIDVIKCHRNILLRKEILLLVVTICFIQNCQSQTTKFVNAGGFIQNSTEQSKVSDSLEIIKNYTTSEQFSNSNVNYVRRRSSLALPSPFRSLKNVPDDNQRVIINLLDDGLVNNLSNNNKLVDPVKINKKLIKKQSSKYKEKISTKKYNSGIKLLFDYVNFTDIDNRRVSNLTLKRSANDNLNLNKLFKNFKSYIQGYSTNVQVPRFLKATGSSFLNGFILGFLAFGLKKLMLPFVIGMQIMKSVLIAMFLPSILGSVGKLVGKGLSNLASGSSLSGSNQPQKLDDFNFNDANLGQYNNGLTPHNNAGVDQDGLQDFMPVGDSSQSYPSNAMNKLQNAMTISGLTQAMNRFSPGAIQNQIANVMAAEPTNYYMQKPVKQKENFKVFHKIPSSSLLLTTYDPFYSPLLSRIDAIFKQMGVVDIQNVEKCRERLVCLMYANPTKYAPYSNLISAQLSRELNELRKPTTDNPDILRFFKYMKAAKDGQDGPLDCPLHKGCPDLSVSKPNPAMLTTYNDINKLVEARKLF